MLGGHGGSTVARKTRRRRRRSSQNRSRPRGPPQEGRRILTGPVGIACVSQREAIIGMRGHYRHTCQMTPSHYRRVKPLSAHVRDSASPHWRTPQRCEAIIGTHSPYRRSRPTERCHYRHAQPLSAHVIRRASHHRPEKPLSALGQSTRRQHRRGSHYRHTWKTLCSGIAAAHRLPGRTRLCRLRSGQKRSGYAAHLQMVDVW